VASGLIYSFVNESGCRLVSDEEQSAHEEAQYMRSFNDSM
jgi:hypothetical protein